MGVSKVNYGNDTLIDLTGDTVTPDTLMEGETAHNRDGNLITGTAVNINNLSASTTTPVDEDIIVTKENANSTWFTKTFAKIWDYIKSKIKSVLHVDTGTIDDIVNVYGSKNLLENALVSETKNNITVTYNSDGTITVNASTASSAETDFAIRGSTYPLFLKAGQYILSGGASNDCYVYIRKRSTFTILATSKGSDATFTVTSEIESDGLWVVLHCNSGKTFDNVTISPMIRCASIQDDTYEPYVPTNRQLLSHEDNGILGAKNLLNTFNFEQKSANGLVSTVDTDGSYRIRGNHNLSSGQTQFFCYGNKIKAGNYIFSLGVSVLGTSLIILNDNLTALGNYKIISSLGSGDSVAFSITQEDLSTYPYLVIDLGISSSIKSVDRTFYPMLRLASDSDNTYQPYAKTNKQLTDDKAEKKDLTRINITSGTTNNTGSTITAGKYFYYNGALVKAKVDIANGATLTFNTNYESAYMGDDVATIKSSLATKISGFGTVDTNISFPYTPTKDGFLICKTYGNNYYYTVQIQNGRQVLHCQASGAQSAISMCCVKKDVTYTNSSSGTISTLELSFYPLV